MVFSGLSVGIGVTPTVLSTVFSHVGTTATDDDVYSNNVQLVPSP